MGDANPAPPEEAVILHGTAVALEGRALLIRGASGSGKSALALELMALGSALVADDRVRVERRNEALILSAPEAIRGLIEARGVGILRAETVPEAKLAAIVDLDREESARLPEIRHETLLSCPVPLLHNFARHHFAAALLQYLKGGREE